MSDGHDPEIERLEADLHQSRFSKWDVEQFLVERHQAKIAALTQRHGKRGFRFQIAKELSDAVFVFLGQVTAITLMGHWVLTGQLLP